MKIKKTIAVSIAAAALSAAAGFRPEWESIEAEYKVPEWFEDAKFGIFCHWGVQCVPEAGDWYAREMYGDPRRGRGKFHREHYGDPKKVGFKDLIPLWKAEKWNPGELCALYRKMGAKYIVAMANHHDGFDNWDSPLQPWNSVNMGPKRDIIGDWAKAAAKEGLRFGASFHASHTWTWMEPSRDYDGLATKEDIRYTASKDGRTVYAIALVPPADGEKPVCGELEKAGIALGERLEQVKDFPAVWRCRVEKGLR